MKQSTSLHVMLLCIHCTLFNFTLLYFFYCICSLSLQKCCFIPCMLSTAHRENDFTFPPWTVIRALVRPLLLRLNHLWIIAEEAHLPGSERWGGWAVSAEKAHKALGSVAPGQKPTSSAWCTPPSDPVQGRTKQQHLSLPCYSKEINTQRRRNVYVTLPSDSAEPGPHDWPPDDRRT